ncbi:LPD29 domain-containing protein [Chamaesiphon sp.]|uniref:LPD29 domain-containing protein n=1 Tax=Chamaesiphon sp. TaxID=2814140 RepID=UPI0035940D16
MTTYTSTQTAKFVRAELKSAFPKQKFSVTSSRHSIDVSWFDGASTKEVAAITDKFGGMEFDGMRDCDTFQKTMVNGEQVLYYCYAPNLHHRFTHSFAQKVVAKALQLKPYLQLEIIGYDTHAAIDYTDGWNGLTRSNMAEIIDNVSESNLQDFSIPSQIAILGEANDSDLEVEIEIVPISIVHVENVEAQGTFPSFNKYDCLDGYIEQVQPAPTNVRITDRIELSNSDYDIFINSLLDDREWLAGKGGSGSTTRPDMDSDNFNYTEADWVEYRQGVYLLVVEVFAADRAVIYIDPQGFNHARYVGFPVEPAEPLAANFDIPILHGRSFANANEPPKTPLQDRYRLWVTAQIERGAIDRIQSYAAWAAFQMPIVYQEWVTAQIALGSIDQIVSFDDWVKTIA